MGKNLFQLAKKPVSTNQNEGFVSDIHFQCLKNRYYSGLHYPENPLWLTRMQNLFTNTFPLDRKIKLPVAGVSENRRKNWFPLARKSVSTSRNKVIFQKLDFPRGFHYQIKICK